MASSKSNPLPNLNHPHIRKQLELAFKAGQALVESEWYKAELCKGPKNFKEPNYDDFNSYISVTYPTREKKGKKKKNLLERGVVSQHPLENYRYWKDRLSKAVVGTEEFKLASGKMQHYLNQLTTSYSVKKDGTNNNRSRSKR